MESGEESEEWKQIQRQFLRKDERVIRSFTAYLGSGDKGRCSNLKKAIVFLNEKSDDINEFGTYVIVRCVLQLTIQSYSLNDDDVVDMMHFVNTEARHFGTPALIKAIDYCLEFMKRENDSDLPVRWIEIFGKLVAVLAIRGELEYDDEQIDGQQFKNNVIVAICRLPWGQNNGASLIAALREIPGLNVHEIEIILDKAGTSMKDLEPSAVPPIAYQLLLLAGSTQPARLVYYFDKYFAEIYDKENIEETQALKKKKALGTTVFHFVQEAKTTDAVLKELMRRIKSAQFDPDLVMRPFMLSVALGLTSIEYIKLTVLDGLRSTILRRFNEIQFSEDSSWYFAMFGSVSADSVMERFRVVVEAKTSELDFMLDGIKELGVILVNSEALVGPSQHCKDKCRGLGYFLLMAIVERHINYLPTLMNEFLKNQTSLANIEGLAKCLAKVNASLVRREYSNRLHELIHYLPLMTVETASPILKALLPAFQLSSDLLGELLMVTKKTIWKSVEARRVSVTAMILLLTNSTIIGVIPQTQLFMTQDWTNSQGPSQAVRTNVLGDSSKNESVCFEVLSILKRFFTQQLEVREHVYLGVRTIVKKNPELIPIICSHLQMHSRQHMGTDFKSLILDNVLTSSAGGEVVLLDNLGLLIQTIGVLTLKAHHVYGQDEVDSLDSLPKSVFICERILLVWATCILEAGNGHFENAAAKALIGDGGSSKSLDVVRFVRNHYIAQYMQVLEALIEFLCMGGGQNAFGVEFKGSTIRELKVKELFKKFQDLAPGLKPKSSKRGKGSKKDKDKTADITSTAGTDPASGTTASTGNKTKLKLESSKKISYTHIIAIESINKILVDLYHADCGEDDPIAEVKYLLDFDKFILEAIKQKTATLRNKEEPKERVTKFVHLMGKLTKSCFFLWNKVNENTKDNFDAVSESNANESRHGQAEVVSLGNLELDELRLELISDILELAYQRIPMLRQKIFAEFLQESGKSYAEMFDIFFEQWKTQYDNQVVVTAKVGGKNSKAIYYMFRILGTLLLELPVQSKEVLEKVANWFEILLKKKGHLEPSCVVMEPILHNLIALSSKVHAIPNMLIPYVQRAHYILGDVEEDYKVSTGQRCWLITKETAPTLVYLFGLHAEKMLDLVKCIVNRINLPSSYSEEEMLKELRNNCCEMMTFILQVLSELIGSNFPAGQCIDVLQKAVVRFFNVMTSITESFVQLHLKHNRLVFDCQKFEQLAREIGHNFKMRVESLIVHIDELRRGVGAAVGDAVNSKKTKNKKAVKQVAKTKFAKDARTIPGLVYSIEKYEQQLIVLCDKAKVNLLSGTKQTTARDFKIEVHKLHSNMSRKTPETDTTEDAEDLDDPYEAVRGRNRSGDDGYTTAMSSKSNKKGNTQLQLQSKPRSGTSQLAKAGTSSKSKEQNTGKSSAVTNKNSNLKERGNTSRSQAGKSDPRLSQSAQPKNRINGLASAVDSSDSDEESVVESRQKKRSKTSVPPRDIGTVGEETEEEDQPSTSKKSAMPRASTSIQNKPGPASKKKSMQPRADKDPVAPVRLGDAFAKALSSSYVGLFQDSSEDERMDDDADTSETCLVVGTPDSREIEEDEEEQDLALLRIGSSKNRKTARSPELNYSSSDEESEPKRKPAGTSGVHRNHSASQFVRSSSSPIAGPSAANNEQRNANANLIDLPSNGQARAASRSDSIAAPAKRRLGLGLKRKKTT